MHIKIKVSHFVIGILLLAGLLWAGISFAGNLDSPGAPEATSSYSLEDLYQRLAAGTEDASKVFTEPLRIPTHIDRSRFTSIGSV